MTTTDFTARELHALRLPQLRAIAKEQGIRRISTLRKPELVSALLQAQNNSSQSPAATNTPSTDSRPTDSRPTDSASTRSRSVSSRSAGSRSVSSRSADSASSKPNAEDATSSVNDDDKTDSFKGLDLGFITNQGSDDLRKDQSEESSTAEDDSDKDDELPIASSPRRRKRTSQVGVRRVRREAKAPQQEPEQPLLDVRQELKVGLDGVKDSRQDSERRPNVRERKRRLQDRYQNDQDQRSKDSRSEAENRYDAMNAKFDRKDRQQRDWGEREGREYRPSQPNNNTGDEEVLIPIAGILDIQPNHAFVRTSGYLPGPNDIYVTLGQVRRWSLRSGDAVSGAVRPRDENDPATRRQKYNALVRLDSVNGMSIDDARKRKEFKSLTPLYPQEQLRLETVSKSLTQRTIDLVAPIGKGQRGLIVSPPKAGKTIILQQIANAITRNNPECHLMVVLVDERPEEVTDMQRTVKGEIIASTFDRPASDHTTVAELAIERAKRLVELDQDVVVLLDSITRLGRAYNIAAPASGRILSGGVDASALYPPKKFFGAARNVENGGSLTILATALVETGSKMDEVIFEEFKGTGNMELRLSRELADRRVFPAVDVNASGTRREELLLTKEELAITWKLRRMMGSLESTKATEFLLSKLKETGTNAEFLMALAKMTPAKE